MPMIPCPHPDRCHAQYHRAGSAAARNCASRGAAAPRVALVGNSVQPPAPDSPARPNGHVADSDLWVEHREAATQLADQGFRPYSKYDVLYAHYGQQPVEVVTDPEGDRIGMSLVGVDSFVNEDDDYEEWYRLDIVDGSTVELPSYGEIWARYPASPSNDDWRRDPRLSSGRIR